MASSFASSALPDVARNPNSTAFLLPSFTGSSPTQPTQTSTDNNDSNNNNNSSTSSSLYLFTFLATLLLLLSVSCAIVVRSLIIRRRYQRRVQEALAQGIILPPPSHQRRKDFGEKPKLWDAHAGPPEVLGPSWLGLMPVSVRVIHDKLSGAGKRIVSSPSRPTFMQNASVRLAQAHRWRPPFFRSRSHARSTPEPWPNANASNAQTNGDVANAGGQGNVVMEDARLQVNVLIAMPSPYRPKAWEEGSAKGKTRSSSQNHADNDDEEVPDVVFGVVEVPWKVTVEQPVAIDTPAAPNAEQESTPDARR